MFSRTFQSLMLSPPSCLDSLFSSSSPRQQCRVAALLEHHSPEIPVAAAFAQVEPSQCPPAFSVGSGSSWRPRACCIWAAGGQSLCLLPSGLNAILSTLESFPELGTAYKMQLLYSRKAPETSTSWERKAAAFRIKPCPYWAEEVNIPALNFLIPGVPPKCVC